jgi:hypothetical protein
VVEIVLGVIYGVIVLATTATYLLVT